MIVLILIAVLLILIAVLLILIAVLLMLIAVLPILTAVLILIIRFTCGRGWGYSGIPCTFRAYHAREEVLFI